MQKNVCAVHQDPRILFLDNLTKIGTFSTFDLSRYLYQNNSCTNSTVWYCTFERYIKSTGYAKKLKQFAKGTR